MVILDYGIAYSQNFSPAVNYDSINIDISLKQLTWEDGNAYQFISIEVTGLPEINMHRDQPVNSPDSLNLYKIINPPAYGGSYSPVVLMSQHQTFQPIKTNVKVIYDSLTNSHKMRHTSLYLVDDFNNLKRKDQLILYSRGCFGFSNRSQADC